MQIICLTPQTNQETALKEIIFNIDFHLSLSLFSIVDNTREAVLEHSQIQDK